MAFVVSAREGGVDLSRYSKLTESEDGVSAREGGVDLSIIT